MWIWKRKPVPDGFPNDFEPQRIGIADAKAIADLPPPDIAQYFRDNPLTAERLLSESEDKRFTPSTFIRKDRMAFRVGWQSRRDGTKCVQEFSDLADAATDYLLFSLGKRRWATSDPSKRTSERRIRDTAVD